MATCALTPSENKTPWLPTTKAAAIESGYAWGGRKGCFQEAFPTPSMPLVEDRFESMADNSHDPSFDIKLLARLVELMGVRARFSLSFALQQRFGAAPHDVEKAVQLMLRCLRLLHLCGYPRGDIEVIVAHASLYLRDLMVLMHESGQPEFGISELAHVFCVLMYVAHAYTEDQNCPLGIWHKHLFMRYCDMATLNDAVVAIMRQLGFTLRLKDPELRSRLAVLQGDCEKAAKGDVNSPQPGQAKSPEAKSRSPASRGRRGEARRGDAKAQESRAKDRRATWEDPPAAA